MLQKTLSKVKVVLPTEADDGLLSETGPGERLASPFPRLLLVSPSCVDMDTHKYTRNMEETTRVSIDICWLTTWRRERSRNIQEKQGVEF